MRHSFKKYFRNVDKVLFLSVMLLIAIGLVLIASATHANIPGPHRYRFVFRQALFCRIRQRPAIRLVAKLCFN